MKNSKKCCWLRERVIVEEVNGGDNSTNSKNKDLEERAINIHGGMEHDMAEYANYYYYGSTKSSRNSEFTNETDHSKKDFFGYW